MSIAIKMEDNIKELDVWLHRVKDPALLNAAKTTLRRSLKTLSSLTGKAVRKNIAVKSKLLRDSYFKEEKSLKGKDINAIYTSLNIRARKPLSLIHFVVGSKQPRKQKGVKPKRRRKVSIQVVPGRRTTPKGIFIAKGRGDVYQVFRRSKTKKNEKGKATLIKQSAPDIQFYVKNPRVMGPVRKEIAQRLQKEFKAQLRWQIKKLRK